MGNILSRCEPRYTRTGFMNVRRISFCVREVYSHGISLIVPPSPCEIVLKMREKRLKKSLSLSTVLSPQKLVQPKSFGELVEI